MGVWIETSAFLKTFRFVQSHPSWVCGLKLYKGKENGEVDESHPSWVCGLKLRQTCKCLIKYRVTPFVGVWIETEEEDCEEAV